MSGKHLQVNTLLLHWLQGQDTPCTQKEALNRILAIENQNFIIRKNPDPKIRQIEKTINEYLDIIYSTKAANAI